MDNQNTMGQLTVNMDLVNLDKKSIWSADTVIIDDTADESIWTDVDLEDTADTKNAENAARAREFALTWLLNRSDVSSGTPFSTILTAPPEASPC